MLTVSSLPGLIDLAPVKPAAGSVGGFAPLMAGLLGSEITTDCNSLPPGGAVLPVPIPATSPIPVSLAADAPAEPPAILVVPGLPSLIDHDEPAPAPPGTIPDAPTPVRFAPIVVPVAPMETPTPATDPAPPTGAADVTEEPRPTIAGMRTALLTSTATPPPVMPAPTLVTPRPTIDPPAPADGPVQPVVPGRKSVTTEPASRAVDKDPRPAAAPDPAPVRSDAPVAPEAIPPVVAPMVAPPSAETPPAMTTSSAPVFSPRTAPHVAFARLKPGAVDAALPAEQRQGREVTTDTSPTAVRSVTAAPAPAVAAATVTPLDVPAPRQAPAVDSAPPAIDAPSTPPPVRSPVTFDRPPRPAMATAVESALSVSNDPAPAIRPTVVVAAPSRTAHAIAAPFVQPMRTAAQSIMPPPTPVAGVAPVAVSTSVAVRPVTTPLIMTDPPIPASVTDVPTAGGAMASAPDSPRQEAPARERGASILTPAVAPTATPAAAAPVILPALQAFGAAIRRAMADERKPAVSSDDTILGLPTLVATTAPAIANAVTPGDTTLDTADRRWPHAMAEQIEKLRDAADSQSTRIRLLPDALGPVDVAVRRDGDQVHVHFAAADAQTRQLLADAQPRLADAAEARGLKLGRTDVSGGDLTGGDRQQQQRSAPQGQQPSRSAPARARALHADTDDSRLA